MGCFSIPLLISSQPNFIVCRLIILRCSLAESLSGNQPMSYSAMRSTTPNKTRNVIDIANCSASIAFFIFFP